MEVNMQFVCNTMDLNQALSTVIHALPQKSPKVVLEGIQIQALSDSIVLTATDMVIGIECKIDAVVKEEGCVIVPGRYFCEIVRKLPGDEISIAVNDRMMIGIISGEFRTIISGQDAEEYPELPAVTGNTIHISQKNLKWLINGTIFAVAQDENHPTMNGCLFDIDSHVINVVALDGFRLAILKEATEYEGNPIYAIIGSKPLSDISKIINDTEDEADLCFSRSHVSLTVGNTQLIARLLEGEFTKYKHIVSNEYTTKIRIKRTALEDAIDRAMLIGRETKSKMVTFKIEQEFLTVSIQNVNMEEKIPILMEGKDIEIAFNMKYIMDITRNISDEEIEFNFKSNLTPCNIHPIEGDSYTYIVLPVRF